MILPKKDNDDNSSKPKLSKESIKNHHNSDNVSFIKNYCYVFILVHNLCSLGCKRRQI